MSVVGNDGSFQQVTMRLSANGKAILPAHEYRCMVEGEVIPATR